MPRQDSSLPPGALSSRRSPSTGLAPLPTLAVKEEPIPIGILQDTHDHSGHSTNGAASQTAPESVLPTGKPIPNTITSTNPPPSAANRSRSNDCRKLFGQKTPKPSHTALGTGTGAKAQLLQLQEPMPLQNLQWKAISAPIGCPEFTPHPQGIGRRLPGEVLKGEGSSSSTSEPPQTLPYRHHFTPSAPLPPLGKSQLPEFCYSDVAFSAKGSQNLTDGHSKPVYSCHSHHDKSHLVTKTCLQLSLTPRPKSSRHQNLSTAVTHTTTKVTSSPKKPVYQLSHHITTKSPFVTKTCLQLSLTPRPKSSRHQNLSTAVTHTTTKVISSPKPVYSCHSHHDKKSPRTKTCPTAVTPPRPKSSRHQKPVLQLSLTFTTKVTSSPKPVYSCHSHHDKSHLVTKTCLQLSLPPRPKSSRHQNLSTAVTHTTTKVISSPKPVYSCHSHLDQSHLVTKSVYFCHSHHDKSHLVTKTCLQLSLTPRQKSPRHQNLSTAVTHTSTKVTSSPKPVYSCHSHLDKSHLVTKTCLQLSLTPRQKSPCHQNLSTAVTHTTTKVIS
ncbi:uncharacterized protein LOC135205202 [Macrobrachium nipponense]|uniref:uncharacterized protein LOC135205202 n=1 Tax=Macrobrachium nipponense TaxID=159736 RepID=UPI0030C8C791